MNDSARIPARLACLAAALLVAAGVAACRSDSAPLTTTPGPYGKTLLADVVLSPDQIVRFAGKSHVAGAGARATAQAAGEITDDWVGEPLALAPAGSPYTIVMSIEGNARRDGEVPMMWSAGWLSGNASRGTPVTGGAPLEAKAGQRVVVTRESGPSRVDDAKQVAPTLSLMHVDNLDIDRVEIQVWSGFPKTGWLDVLKSFRVALVGVVMLGVAVLFLRR